MSRRNQSRRRHAYGKRQHEVRERRLDDHPDVDRLGAEGQVPDAWQGADMADMGDESPFRDTYGGYGR